MRKFRKKLAKAAVQPTVKTPEIGVKAKDKVVTLLNPNKRIVTQKVTIFYNEAGEKIWVSYENKTFGKIYKKWRDYISMSKIISLGRTRDHALSYACEIESASGNKAVVTLRQYNNLKDGFDYVEFKKVVDLSYQEAVNMAIDHGLGDLFGYSRGKCLYKDGIRISHPSKDPVKLLKTLARRVHTVVRKDADNDKYLYVFMYGYELKVYIDTKVVNGYLPQKRLA